MLARIESLGNKALVQVLKVAFKIVPEVSPTLLTGAGSSLHLADNIAQAGVEKLLIVTGSGIVKRGQIDSLIRVLETKSINCTIYDGIQPDPTFEIVHEGLDLYKQEGCDGILAVGGGSAMDAAKVIALAVGNNRSPESLKGFFKARKSAVPFFAIPTTAGTGSEVTIAAVISDTITHKKAFVIDPKSVPLAAALDPEMMISIPPLLTAATGMDALTHAVEAYIGTLGNEKTDAYAVDAIKLIYKNLPKACKDGSNIDARANMALASYKAGQAFTRASVGYVHAISHQLGAYYGVAHGLGNAILLPHVVEFSQPKAQEKLANLAVELGLAKDGDSEQELADKFLHSLYALNKKLKLPTTIEELQPRDIPAIARGARTEVLFNYPVPKNMNQRECETLLKKCLAR